MNLNHHTYNQRLFLTLRKLEEAHLSSGDKSLARHQTKAANVKTFKDK